MKAKTKTAAKFGARRIGWVFFAWIIALAVLSALQSAVEKHPEAFGPWLTEMELAVVSAVVAGAIKFLREHRKDAEELGTVPSESLKSAKKGDAIVKKSKLGEDPADEEGDGHASDCAIHNEPALPKGKCDCGRMTNETKTPKTE